MKLTNKSFLNINIFILCCIVLSSCIGPRLNKQNNLSKKIIIRVLASNEDQNIKVDLTDLLIKNSPRSWAKGAKWDEYLFNISNLTNESITIKSIKILDSLGYLSEISTTRRKLIKASKNAKKRFKDAGIKIKIGNGTGKLIAAQVSGYIVGAGIGAGLASGGTVAVSAGTLTTAGGAVFVAVPVALISGIVKLVNNSKVNNRIQKRQTAMPSVITSNKNETIDLMFPVIPSPQTIEITYSLLDEDYSIKIELGESFKGLHYK